jgi:hypothetical protein
MLGTILCVMVGKTFTAKYHPKRNSCREPTLACKVGVRVHTGIVDRASPLNIRWLTGELDRR